jgi:hypothetical protein
MMWKVVAEKGAVIGGEADCERPEHRMAKRPPQGVVGDDLVVCCGRQLGAGAVFEIDRLGRVERALMREHGFASSAVRQSDLAAKRLPTRWAGGAMTRSSGACC